ncbi:hypothetical protein AAA799B03_01287 [Marine Group I thaumarchaeote SCGC AAA799-B03]|uniref:Uncharacterized protein n=2 Tax=Marine Group I TaxID=905826 RepID=A0A087S637_9ARCH|nr:hypothetical protein AAA799N04_01867 [Marine Group I thaumarchaeote SCGC AAA799-N04]KFM21191.1 hypothetical protein AAA799B03_01287 [Marine Group I thaumarchaeote SCGC AAA799-B03]
MTLEFPKLTLEGILELAENPCPTCELSKMSSYEYNVLNERIDKMIKHNPVDGKLFTKLMRLKSFLMLEV